MTELSVLSFFSLFSIHTNLSPASASASMQCISFKINYVDSQPAQQSVVVSALAV